MRHSAPASGEQQRLIEALATLIEDRGYAATTVVDIVRVASASKRTFYRHFDNKQQCYLALLQSRTAVLVDRIRAEVDEQAHWHDQVRQMIEAYARHLGSRPLVSLSWIRDLPALGLSARPTQRANYTALADVIADMSTNPGFRRAGVPPVTKVKMVILLGGLRELAAQTVEDDGDLEQAVREATEIAIAILQTPSGVGVQPVGQVPAASRSTGADCASTGSP